MNFAPPPTPPPLFLYSLFDFVNVELVYRLAAVVGNFVIVVVVVVLVRICSNIAWLKMGLTRRWSLFECEGCGEGC